MKQEVILLKYGEIVLKGLNRPQFEAQLMRTIKERLAPLGRFATKYAQSTVYVIPQDQDIDIDEAARRLCKVFGILSVTRALEVPKELDQIKAAAKDYAAPALMDARSFKVTAKRSDKRFPLTSPEIMIDVGGFLADAFPHLTVDVRHPEVNVTVEIRDFAAYIHTNPLPGAGGMPTGSNGKGMLLISGGIDSPVAGYMMAKRGLSLGAVHFFSYPYTSERAREKVLDLIGSLAGYCGPVKTYIVPFTEIQEEIRKNCREEFFTLVMRRLMMKISAELAKTAGAKALITGESLGQVASQTLEALGVTDAAAEIPVFRPVIGMDKDEIVAMARKIGTYETSILPYEDCCTVFTPRHPKTRPAIAEAEAEENKLDCPALIGRAVAGTDVMIIKEGRR